MKRFFVLIGFALFLGCGSLEYVNLPQEPNLSTNLVGKKIVLPMFPVQFSTFRLIAIDARTVKINDQRISEKYAVTEEDSIIGKVGVVMANALKEIDASKSQFADLIQETYPKLLLGEENYHVPWFKGLGPGGMGEISNVPIDYDRTVYPAKILYQQPEVQKQYAAEVFPLDRELTISSIDSNLDELNAMYNPDYYLMGGLDIHSEAVEVLETSFGTYNDEDGNFLVYENGDFFIQYSFTLSWYLVDAKTGKVMADDVSAKSPHTIDGIVSKVFRLNVPKSDFSAFKVEAAKGEFVKKIKAGVKNAIAETLQHFVPYNLYTSVAAE